MLHLELTDGHGAIRQIHVPDDSVIGKGADCEIRLDSWRVGKEHARLFRTPAGILLDDLGAFGGIQVNGERIQGQYGPLKAHDQIAIGPFRLNVTDAERGATSARAAHPESRSTSAAERNRMASESLSQALRAAEDARDRHWAKQTPPSDADELATPSTAIVPAPYPDRKNAEFEWRKTLHSRLLEAMDLRRHDVHGMSDDLLREQTEVLVRELLAESDAEIPPSIDRDALCKHVLDEAIGLGPLEELLTDDSVTEIMVNRYDQIYIERAGRLLQHPLTFTGHRAVLGVIERIVTPLGRRIDESSPMVDARLKDGSRVNAIIPPLALKGPCITIRKFSNRKLTTSDLIEFGAINAEMSEFLKVCVESRKNIIVSGGTGSGKTTLLNILSNYIPLGERVITVEDAAELKLHHAHLISLESRPANIEGKGAVTIRELVKNTLRMRPDRIVVGECRGAEALDMLQAMNTGHEGSLTTLHANSPRDALARLETLVLMAGMDLPLVAIREQIASAVDIIVQQTRFSCGSRKIVSVAEITGMESGKIQVQELFHYVNVGYKPRQGGGSVVDGYFTGCDMVPSFYEDLRATGHAPDMRIFKPTHPFGPESDSIRDDEQE